MPERTCSLDGCDRPFYAKGYCNLHWRRERQNGDPNLARKPGPTLRERLLSHVDTTDPGQCWHMDNPDEQGYSNLRVGPKMRKAHRVAYELFVGPIPDGHEVDHDCHNSDPSCAGGVSCLHRACVNPAHLEAVTGEVNCKRSQNYCGNRTECRHGHPYDEQNTRWYKGRRWCRQCDRDRKLAKARAVYDRAGGWGPWSCA